MTMINSCIFYRSANQWYVQSEQSPGLKEAASVQIESLWPYMLQFLSNEYDDTSVRVLPFVNDSLQMVS
jgi:hypothetical protein